MGLLNHPKWVTLAIGLYKSLRIEHMKYRNKKITTFLWFPIETKTKLNNLFSFLDKNGNLICLILVSFHININCNATKSGIANILSNWCIVPTLFLYPLQCLMVVVYFFIILTEWFSSSDFKVLLKSYFLHCFFLSFRRFFILPLVLIFWVFLCLKLYGIKSISESVV